ncbi:MAG: septum site-determining protein MinC [Spirulina sp. SIO3F2]|nr:septum site-determining protein MinC [Spirulina sp. SIO3F2]
MTPKANAKLSDLIPPQTVALGKADAQVRLTRQDDCIQILLPDPEVAGSSWLELWDSLKQRLHNTEAFWKSGAIAKLWAGKHLLDSRQLQAIADALAKVRLDLRWVVTARRQTAVAAAGSGFSVEQITPKAPDQPTPDLASSAEYWAEPLYVKSTLRSGQEVSHPGTVIVCGDTNPGSTIVAAGDIIVLGRLRGIAHAGSQGNAACQIFALRMEAMQLRIAQSLARPPEADPDQLYPEMAYLTESGIRLAPADNFFKTHRFAIDQNIWLDSA